MSIKMIIPKWTCILIVGVFLVFNGCKPDDKGAGDGKSKVEKPAQPTVKIPLFSSDSAYHFIQKQLDFGPRVPNSDAAAQCLDWYVKKFKSYDAKVHIQRFEANRFDDVKLKGANVIASYNPKSTYRIIIAAHWDSRYVADEDTDPALASQPVPAADDGASGVAVIMELARLLQQVPINLGVDLILFDAEDQGVSAEGQTYSWCLGAQHWAKNPHVKNYIGQYGILLDMVGSKNARFPKEGLSMHYAKNVVNKVWRLAQRMNAGKYFVNATCPSLTDDHQMVNEFAGIPMIDIINKPVDSDTGFGHHWHTHKDNMDIISKGTLSKVGQVVTAVIYNDAMNKL